MKEHIYTTFMMKIQNMTIQQYILKIVYLFITKYVIFAFNQIVTSAGKFGNIMLEIEVQIINQ